MLVLSAKNNQEFFLFDSEAGAFLGVVCVTRTAGKRARLNLGLAPHIKVERQENLTPEHWRMIGEAARREADAKQAEVVPSPPPPPPKAASGESCAIQVKRPLIK